MISKLKAECGSGFTSKLEGMFKDVELSRDVMASFRESSHAQSMPSEVELSVHVLTQGYWPTYPPVEVNLPQEVLTLQNTFNTYYQNKHNGRRLQWHPYLGHCTLKASFPHGRKELIVSLLQGIVLLLFNDQERIPYSDILSATGMDDRELKVTLQVGSSKQHLSHHFTSLCSHPPALHFPYSRWRAARRGCCARSQRGGTSMTAMSSFMRGTSGTREHTAKPHCSST